MNSIHINTSFSWGGGEQQTLYLLKGLSDEGLRVLLVAQPGSPMADKAHKSGIKVEEIMMKGEFSLCAHRKLKKIISSFRPAFIQSHTAHAVTYGGLVGGKSAVKIAVRRVDYSIHRKSPFKLSSFKYTRLTDHIVCISKTIMNILLDDGIPGEKMSLIYSAIDPSRFAGRPDPHALRVAFGLKEDETVIGNIASLKNYKGHDILIKAAKLVAEKTGKIRFVIVGDGPLKEDLSKQIKEIGLPDIITMSGFRNDVPELLSMFDVFVMSSRTEGLCTSILDAMASGTPVVATDAGGITELVQNGTNGIVVPKENPEELADAILCLANDPDKRKDLSIEGIRTVNRNFTVQRMVREYITLYRQLLG